VNDLLLVIAADPAQLALACIAAFGASILGGLAGYGTGLVLPVFLAPLVGVVNVVPVMAVAMLFNNGSRVVAFKREIRWPEVRRFLLLGLPACVLGAYGYTRLDERAVGLLLGTFLLASVVIRRSGRLSRLKLGPRAQAGAGACFGFVNGVVTGAGVLLISLLMSSGVAGKALIATDAVISLVMGVAKVVLFGSVAALDARLALTGLLIGACAIPGAFVARALIERIPARVHGWILEGTVVAGALWMLWRALR